MFRHFFGAGGPETGGGGWRSHPETAPQASAFTIPDLPALIQHQRLFEPTGPWHHRRRRHSETQSIAAEVLRESDPERAAELEIIAANAKEIVTEQCNIKERTTARPENLDRAAVFIQRRLEKILGPNNVQLQPYVIKNVQVLEDNFNKWKKHQPESEVVFERNKIEGKTYNNVVATINDRQEQTQPVLVIGAHYDALGLKNPGADDNSSAVAGMLELARLLKNYTGPYKIELVAYANEEVPAYQTEYMGSYVHAQDLARRQAKARFSVVAIVLDMIGQYSSDPADQKMISVFKILKPLLGIPSVPNYAALVGTRQDALFARTLQATLNATSRIRTVAATVLQNSRFFEKNLDQTDSWSYHKLLPESPTLFVSDMAPFRKNPKAGGVVTYHTEHDTPDTLDYESMAELIWGLKHAIEALPVPELLQPDQLRSTWQELQPPQLEPAAKRRKQQYLIDKVDIGTGLTDDDLYYLFLTHWDELGLSDSFNSNSLRNAQERALKKEGVSDRVERLLLWVFTGSKRSLDKKASWLIKCTQWPLSRPDLFPNLLQQLQARSQSLPDVISREIGRTSDSLSRASDKVVL